MEAARFAEIAPGVRNDLFRYFLAGLPSCVFTIRAGRALSALARLNLARDQPDQLERHPDQKCDPRGRCKNASRKDQLRDNRPDNTSSEFFRVWTLINHLRHA